MIRSTLKKIVRKALGRPEKKPAAAAPATARWTPPAPSSRPDEEEEDHGHSHSHGHSHGHSHDHEDEEPQLEVDDQGLREWMGKDKIVLLDVREPNELLAGHAEGALLIPMNQVPQRLAEIPKGQKLVVYCAAGGRSYGVAGFLRERGYDEAWSLAGGFGAYVQAGGKWVRPPAKAKFPITSRVKITRDPLTIDGIVVPPSSKAGTVQEIRETEAGMRYAVGLVDEGGRPFVVHDIGEDELSR
jgi:rhodanese-related sulfurtransferase